VGSREGFQKNETAHNPEKERFRVEALGGMQERTEVDCTGPSGFTRLEEARHVMNGEESGKVSIKKWLETKTRDSGPNLFFPKGYGMGKALPAGGGRKSVPQGYSSVDLLGGSAKDMKSRRQFRGQSFIMLARAPLPGTGSPESLWGQKSRKRGKKPARYENFCLGRGDLP